MWSKNPTPVRRAPWPLPSRARLSRMLVSLVVRATSAARGVSVITAIVSHARLHRLGVDHEPLGSGDRRAGGGQRGCGAGGGPPPPGPERGRREPAGEARRSGGGKDVVGAGDVVAEGGAAARSHED